LIDCLVFCIFLAPQLLIQVGIFSTVFTTLQCLPFLSEPPTTNDSNASDTMF
jgi:hypothetical protein